MTSTSTRSRKEANEYMEFWRDSSNYHEDLPSYKRAVELWVNDSRFQKNYKIDPSKTLREAGLEKIKPLELDIMVDKEVAVQYAASSGAQVPILVKQYRDFIQAKMRHCVEIRDSHPDHTLWQKWRKRMVNATLWREGPRKHAKLVHAPFTVELTHGCTVGCWFCGVDAEKFQGPVEMRPEVKENWRDMLEGFKEICGQESAQHGFCYWATDPLDHPEYEWFLEEFHNVLDYWPQTTTAQVMKHAPRVRKLFETIKSKNAFVQRFSMTRSTDLGEIYKFFRPEELFLCELIPQYDDKQSPKATAGRVRDLVLKKRDQDKDVNFHYDLEATGSIACVSGFLINLVQRSIKLITPCEASDRWPLGYRILGEYTYSYEEKMEDVIRTMLDGCLNDRLAPDDQLKGQRGVVFGADEHGTKLTATSHGYTFNMKNIDNAHQFARLLTEGTHTVEEICTAMSSQGATRLQTLINLHQLFEQGIFDEDIIDSGRKSLVEKEVA